MKRKKIRTNLYKQTVHIGKIKTAGAFFLIVLLLPYICTVFCRRGELEVERKYADDENFMREIEIETSEGKEVIPVEQYVLHALGLTIPSDYEEECLKAQSIILRTNLYYMQENQLDMTEVSEIMKTTWNPNMEEEYKRLKEIVVKTNGITAVYQGSYVEFPYFAVSAGKTRNGEEVFGNDDYPYLQAVSCEKDIEAEQYNKKYNIKKTDFYERLGASGEFSAISKDEAGYYTEVKVGDTVLIGEEFRNILNLNSAAFELSETQEEFLITTKGVGHGLGFCQYSANEMAKEGSTYMDLIKYFFNNVEMQKLE